MLCNELAWHQNENQPLRHLYLSQLKDGWLNHMTLQVSLNFFASTNYMTVASRCLRSENITLYWCMPQKTKIGVPPASVGLSVPWQRVGLGSELRCVSCRRHTLSPAADVNVPVSHPLGFFPACPDRLCCLTRL